MHMERFIARENIKRYRRLLDVASDDVQRRQIHNLLVEEEERAKELGAVELGLGVNERPRDRASDH